MESRHATILCFLFAGLLLFFIFNQTSDGSIPLFAFQSSQYCKPSTQSNTRNYTDALESALSEASMADKTVIIAIVNKAYVEGDKPMLDLFLDGFWLGEDTRGLIPHLLLVAVDQTSFER